MRCSVASGSGCGVVLVELSSACLRRSRKPSEHRDDVVCLLRFVVGRAQRVMGGVGFVDADCDGAGHGPSVSLWGVCEQGRWSLVVCPVRTPLRDDIAADEQLHRRGDEGSTHGGGSSRARWESRC